MNELVHVTDVEVLDEHRLRLTFEDGIVGDIGFEDHDWRGVFEPLRDPRRFERVCVEPACGTIVWPEHGLDMAPEPLYEEALAHQIPRAQAAAARSTRKRRPILRLHAPDPRMGKFTTTSYHRYSCPLLYQRSDQGGVPKVSSFYGIVITMHWSEGAHNRPHFHARYGEHEASFDLAGRIIVGSLPTRALRHVRDWAKLHPDELDANWQRVVHKQPPEQIAPLI